MLCFLLLSVQLLMAVWVASSVGFYVPWHIFEPLLSLLLNTYQRVGYSFMVRSQLSVGVYQENFLQHSLAFF